MHIPKTPTSELEILTFEKALSEALTAKEDYDVEKWLYVPPSYCEYRYILGTRGKKPLICIGINPSTATPDNLDNTLKSVERIAHYNGYDSFIMFNVYAQRATDPDMMEKELNRELHMQNLEAFSYILENSVNTPGIWAAWGAIVEKRDYLYGCILDMAEISERYGAKWYTSGAISKKGHPHHPLYLKSTSGLDEFDIRKYCDEKLLALMK